jgi:hypothetical protein
LYLKENRILLELVAEIFEECCLFQNISSYLFFFYFFSKNNFKIFS